MNKIKLSVLDLVLKCDKDNNIRTFKRAVKAAKYAEKLGYERFWMGEHHNAEYTLCSATPILINYVASKTKKIRVGSGGIMLPNHNTLLVAEQFGTLETIHPNRIDLGVGRGAGGNQEVAKLLSKNGASFSLQNEVENLIQYFTNQDSSNTMRAFPGEGQEASIWILGASMESAEIAAELALPFVFGGHFSLNHLPEVAKAYHSRFKPTSKLEKPYFVLSLNVIAGKNKKEARYLSTSFLNMIAGDKAGRKVPFAMPTNELIYKGNRKIEELMEPIESSCIIGDTDFISKKLNDLITQTVASEIMVLNYIYDEKHRKNGFKYIKKALSKRI